MWLHKCIKIEGVIEISLAKCVALEVGLKAGEKGYLLLYWLFHLHKSSL